MCVCVLKKLKVYNNILREKKIIKRITHAFLWWTKNKKVFSLDYLVSCSIFVLILDFIQHTHTQIDYRKRKKRKQIDKFQFCTFFVFLNSINACMKIHRVFKMNSSPILPTSNSILIQPLILPTEELSSKKWTK